MTAQASQIQLQVLSGAHDHDHEHDKEAEATEAAGSRPKRHYWWWVKVGIYTILILLGQSVALLLGRFYFLKGGSSKWVSSVVQVAGFPILIPYYLLTVTAPSSSNQQVENPPPHPQNPKPPSPSPLTLASIYGGFGLILGLNCFLYSVGLQYLPVSTYTLLCSSQLAFNSFFSYFLNSQKFTPYVLNSLLLLTLSSVLLIFNNQDDAAGTGPHTSRAKYTTGFLCTLAASALYGLFLSLTEFIFPRVSSSNGQGRTPFRHVMDLNISANFVATLVTLVGLFASGEWRGLGDEMDAFGPGTVSYWMTLVWIAVFWQLFFIGIVGLIFEVSSLFSNSISTAGAPVVPIMAVFLFKDKMSGVKGVSMALSVWGFVSYVYPYYVDVDYQNKAKTGSGKTTSVDDHPVSSSSASETSK